MRNDKNLLPPPNRDWALFLDLDGTLIDLAPTPRAVTVPIELPALLTRLWLAFDGALAIISGRAVGDIDLLLRPLTLAAAGQHGAQIRLPGGTIEHFGSAEALADLLPRIDAYVAARPGLLVENKGRTIALHYRLASRHEDELERFVVDLVTERADRLEAIRGHCVFEIRLRGLDKGSAIRRLMGVEPFSGRTPVFIGDDRTDEDGFVAVIHLDGIAVRVGPRDPSQTTATWQIADPAAVRSWLTWVADTLLPAPG